MTEKEVRVWLNSIKIDLDRMEKKIEQKQELQAVAESCTVRTDKESIQTSGSGDKMANIVGKIVDLERTIRRLEENLHERRQLVTELAAEISNDRHSQYIKLRYVKCNPFFDTVMIMDLTDSTARRIDRRAVSDLTKVINSHKHNI